MATIAQSRLFVRLFKPRFAPLVEAGTKSQTVRPKPKRMPRAGDRISLRTWLGRPRFSKQRILRESIIEDVLEIKIASNELRIVRPSPELDYFPDRERFAIADGFPTWAEIVQWFEHEHGLPFQGILITWQSNSDPKTKPGFAQSSWRWV